MDGAVDFVSFLNDPDLPQDVSDPIGETVVRFEALMQAFDKAGQRLALTPVVAAAAARAPAMHPQKGLALLGFHAWLAGTGEAVGRYVDALARLEAADELTTGFWSLSQLAGRMTAGDPFAHRRLEDGRVALHRKLVDLADAAWTQTPRAPDPDPDRIVLLTAQVVGPLHAPTRRSIELAMALAARGWRVTVLNTRAIPTRLGTAVTPALLGHPPAFQATEGPYPLAPAAAEYWHPLAGGFGADDLAAIMGKLASLKPARILAIGGGNPVADAAAADIPTYIWPTTAEVPLTTRAWFATWRPAEAYDWGKTTWAPRDRWVHGGHPGFDIPAPTRVYTRAEFDLPSTAFLIAVIGNRLDVEVSAAFANRIDAILAADASYTVVFGGNFAGFADWLDRRPGWRGRVHHVGQIEDVVAFYGIVDAGLNPWRQGGGRIGVYALSQGVPMLTPDRGDVATAVPVPFVCTDTKTVLARLAALRARDATADAMRETARRAAARVTGVDHMLEAVLAHDPQTV